MDRQGKRKQEPKPKPLVLTSRSTTDLQKKQRQTLIHKPSRKRY